MTNPTTQPNDPAFPIVDGLTKREYFAAMAMQGFIASGTIRETEVLAVQMADALIAELSK